MLLVTINCFGKKEQSNLILLDEVKVLVHGPEAKTIFCSSDEGRHGIDGRPKDIQNCIVEELIFQDAKRMKIPLEPEIIQEHLNRTIRAFGLKPGDEDKVFAQEGYTRAEGLKEFEKIYAVQAMLDFKVKSDLVVTEEQVIKYWEENPIVIEERFCIQTAFVSAQQKSEEGIKEGSQELEKRIDDLIKTGQSKLVINWSDSFWIKGSEVAQDLEMITTMKKGQIIKIARNQGYQLYKLVDYEPEKLVPLHERYREIVDTLKHPMFDKKMKKYHQELLKGATVIYL